MAIPANSFTVEPDVSTFLSPYSDNYNPFTMRCRGGVSIGDGTQGRDIQNWRVSYADPVISVGVDGGPVDFTLNVPGIQIISLAFDNNMGVTLAWQVGSVSSIYYYDGIAQAYITKSYSGTNSCRVVLDDERVYNNAGSDVIFAYVKSDNLYWRQQRDRYDIERLVGPVSPGRKLKRAGQNQSRRLQFELL